MAFKLDFKSATNLLELKESYKILSALENSYPDFYNWYWNKVVPGILTKDDDLILAYSRNELVGISILKNSEEKKLRALRITDKFQNKGYGLYLIDESLKRLDTDKPLCSVSDKMINDYSRIFINKYNFDLTHVYKNLYNKDSLEYEFNGNKQLKIKTNY